MRLIKAKISGFGRLVDEAVNLDNKVIAVVGPNEAGKTTLLKALAYIDNAQTLSRTERSRAKGIPDDDVVVGVQYVLDDSDRQALETYDLEEEPKSLWLSRTASGGGPEARVEPAPRKSAARLPDMLTTLAQNSTAEALSTIDPPKAAEGDEDGAEADEERETLRPRVDSLIDQLVNSDEDPRSTVEESSDEIIHVVQKLRIDEAEGPLVDALEQLHSWVKIEDPTSRVGDFLYKRSPDIVLFDDDNRNLESTYTISQEVVDDPPAALKNLCAMAKLDLEKLRFAIVSSDDGERETQILNANQEIATRSKEAWKQSDVVPHLKIEGEALTLRIKQNGKRITQFDERSAGLRMFVALMAFLAVRGTRVSPVLLIDEAETHLHIDAQQDLVNTFMTQTQAAKIIYTTHSPACLPPDLGTNIRAVLPAEDKGDVSRIEGSFWRRAAGYSPLMLAMGAAAAAFSTARFVVLAEGASEMLMLPTLIRASIGADDLNYQVAPGLSEVPTAMYPELDLEGAHVAYLVDGDDGGLMRRKALIHGGVPEKRIITLGALTLENLLDAQAYSSVVEMLLRECNPSMEVPALPELSGPSESPWPTILEQWAALHNLKLPGKRVMASRAVEEGMAKPSRFGIDVLKQAHQELTRALEGVE